ncbi:LysR family transcriptional regulator [Xanthobacteraceae bacterium Astr-EGSB]|uniref:LysR family transcriptional regulator n=1 Tax=Astrobacterium formosum TaxID=3069710 RepID=UPI0027B1F2A8|nr:LysR family transcriptional regulator [Xanthobacteraceae bacterium Astr-EGSB]
MDRFEAMSVLLTVVEAGGLSAGARHLRAPLATVSRKFVDLEQHLGTRLVVRTSRRLALTDAGRAFVAASRWILGELEAAERGAAGEYNAACGVLPAYLARRGVPRRVEDLGQHDSISFQGFATAPEWRHRRDSAAFTVEARPTLAVNTTEAAIQAALADLGIIRVLSCQMEDELRSGQLQVLLPEFAPEPLPVSLIYLETERLPLKVRCFLDWIVPRLRARMAGLDAEAPEGRGEGKRHSRTERASP